MSEQRHSMDLDEYARLARFGQPVPHPEGPPIVVSPALADALNVLLSTADDLAVAGPLADALADVRALHDYRTVRMGGQPR